MERTGFLDQLRKTHDVVLFRFDETLQRIASLPKRAAESADAASGQRVGLSAEPSPGDATTNAKSLDPANLRQGLQPSGRETRLGQALQRAINDQRNAPVSGIVLISDGCQNAGTPPETAIELAKEVKFPVYTVGVGSNRRPVRLLAYDLEAPQRADPGDPYTVTGMIQAQGLAGQSATAQLYLKDPAKKTEQLIGSEQVILGADGEVTPVRFQVTPTETGKRQLSFRLQASRAGRNPEDSHREADIEIVDRKTRVLLLPADRCGNTSSCGPFSTATSRPRWMSFCKRPRPGFRKRPTRFSTSSPKPATRCTPTIASSPWIQTGKL